MKKQDSIEVNFDNLLDQGEVLNEMEYFSYKFLYYFYMLVCFNDWKADEGSKVNKKNYDSGTNAKDAAIAMVQRMLISSEIPPNENELENNDHVDFYYCDDGYIKYNGEYYRVDELVTLLNNVYKVFKKKILNKKLIEKFMEDKDVPSDLLNEIVEYINSKLESGDIKFK